MRTLSVFDTISLDGYFTDATGDMSWAHQHDPEWSAFTASNAGAGGVLVFGRVTYDLMASFWPTPAAAAALPAVAERMNALPKLVVSRSIDRPAWNNTTVVRGDLAVEFAKLKAAPGDDMVILGSGQIVAQLCDAGLIDQIQLVVRPIVLGQGRSLFAGAKRRQELTLKDSRRFGNGNVVNWYTPKR